MEELIQKIVDETGISPEQAKSAITTIIDHFKDRLPFGLGDKIEAYLGEGGTEGTEGSSTASGAEGIFDELKGKLPGGLSGLFS